jgi:hypothetical protein
MDNIKMDLGEVGCVGVNWIGLSQDRDRWRDVMNAGKLSRGCTTYGRSSKAQLNRVSYLVMFSKESKLAHYEE